MRKALIAALVLSVAAGAGAVLMAQAGQRATPGTDCVPYDPATLTLTDVGNGTWRLDRGEDGARFRVFANRPDAEAGLAVFKEHKALCYIGRGNSLPDRTRYVMEFLR